MSLHPSAVQGNEGQQLQEEHRQHFNLATHGGNRDFPQLPDELIMRILSLLDLEDLCRIQRVSKAVLSAAVGPSCWESLYRRTFLEIGSGGDGGPQPVQPSNSAAAQSKAPASAGTSSQHAAIAAAAGAGEGSASVPSAGRLSHSRAAVGASSLITASTGSKAGGDRIAWPKGFSSSSSSSKTQQPGLPAASAAAATGAIPAAEAGLGAATDWRQLFKQRYMQQRSAERAKRQRQRQKAASALIRLQQEVHRLQQALARELHRLPLLQAQLAGVQRARQQASTAALAQRYWQPVAVQRAHGVVTDQAPQDAEAVEAGLRQQVAVAELEAAKLRRQLAARRAQEADARRKLAALSP